MGIRYSFSKNLRKPEYSLMGWIITKNLEKRNAFIEQEVVRLAKIEPHYHVLEVGFGPGLGLKAAYPYIKDGTGKLYGVDFSPKMVNMATKRLQHEIEDNKVFLHLASVTKIPYDNDMFHRIIHTNAYYFWPDMDEAIRELYRVIKPDGTMVCVLNLERLKEITELQLMQCGNVDPDRYMESLKRNGFQDVQMNNLKDHKTLQAIFATAIK